MEVIRNDRRRVTFSVLPCVEVLAIREAYRSGRIMVDMHAFRESLKHIRRLTCAELSRSVDGEPEQRSMSHASNLHCLQPVPQYLC